MLQNVETAIKNISGHKNTVEKKPAVLLLTTSLLTDRMFLFSGMLDNLAEETHVRIWADSYLDSRYQKMWENISAEVEEFPTIEPAPFTHNYLRRLNEFAWDFRYKPPSRMSLTKHQGHEKRIDLRALRPVAGLLAFFKLERALENRLEVIMQSQNRSDEAMQRLLAKKPDVLLVTGPFQFSQPAVTALAKKAGIPTLCLIPSWDNVSTKNRMVFKYDGYVVWSEQLKKQLHHFYPHTRDVPVYVTGAAQFDVFFQPEFYQSRAEFCASQNLNPDIPIVVYALGSPNFLKESHGALHLAERIARGELGEIQLLVRPHPIFDNAELNSLFDKFGSLVRVQKLIEPNELSATRSQDRNQIVEWINTFRHADVVVNLSSTVTIDAAIFDRPVVNLDFDPQPGQPDQQLIKDINHLWTHFKPIAESGGVWLVNDFDEMVYAVKEYLKKPELHREKRRWLAEYVCGYLDGKCGERMAEAIIDFARQSSHLS